MKLHEKILYYANNLFAYFTYFNFLGALLLSAVTLLY